MKLFDFVFYVPICLFMLSAFYSCGMSADGANKEEFTANREVLTVTLPDPEEGDIVYGSGGDAPLLAYKLMPFVLKESPEERSYLLVITGVNKQASLKLAEDLRRLGGRAFATISIAGVRWRAPIPHGAYREAPDGTYGWTVIVPAGAKIQDALLSGKRAHSRFSTALASAGLLAISGRWTLQPASHILTKQKPRTLYYQRNVRTAASQRRWLAPICWPSVAIGGFRARFRLLRPQDGA